MKHGQTRTDTDGRGRTRTTKNTFLGRPPKPDTGGRSSRMAGFTLLEVMVALTILGVGIIAIMQLFPTSLRQSRIAAERTTVASLARTELGRVRAGGVFNQGSEEEFVQYIQRWATRNPMRTLNEAQRAYALYEGWRSSVERVQDTVNLFRVTFSVEMSDGREETFVTYVTEL